MQHVVWLSTSTARPSPPPPPPPGAAGMAFIFTWLRLSNARLLDWQRHFSYQPRDITWAQQQV
jgi:hypothetical protein